MNSSAGPYHCGGVDLEENEVKQAVASCLHILYQSDRALFVNDVSERAITHKLAEYLQTQFKDFNVDCEYNRNSGNGLQNPKRLRLLADEKTRIKMKALGQSTNAEEEDEIHLSVSTYPDIIVHHRLSNDHNLLVIEVKKRNSPVSRDYDYRKIEAFTDQSSNPYKYKFGVFILLGTGSENLTPAELVWFKDGRSQS